MISGKKCNKSNENVKKMIFVGKNSSKRWVHKKIVGYEKENQSNWKLKII